MKTIKFTFGLLAIMLASIFTSCDSPDEKIGKNAAAIYNEADLFTLDAQVFLNEAKSDTSLSARKACKTVEALAIGMIFLGLEMSMIKESDNPSRQLEEDRKYIEEWRQMTIDFLTGVKKNDFGSYQQKINDFVDKAEWIVSDTEVLIGIK